MNKQLIAIVGWAVEQFFKYKSLCKFLNSAWNEKEYT